MHVVWNGSKTGDGNQPHEGFPLFYARLDPATDAFVPQRDIIAHTRALDGGGTVAADSFGNVTVAWHAAPPEADAKGESHRRVYISQSIDGGKTFAPEKPATDADLGACACCGMGATSDGCGRVLLLYRAARNDTGRDTVLLRANCGDKSPDSLPYRSSILQEWSIQTCPMSSYSLATDRGRDACLAWETKGQVWFARCAYSDGKVSEPVAPPGGGGARKHPRIAVNSSGQTLLVWTAGTGWQKGGSLAWQVFDDHDKPIAGASGRADGIPVWGFAAAVALPDGHFEILH